MVEEQNVHQNANRNGKNRTLAAAPKAIGGEDILGPYCKAGPRLGADTVGDLKQSLARVREAQIPP